MRILLLVFLLFVALCGASQAMVTQPSVHKHKKIRAHKGYSSLSNQDSRFFYQKEKKEFIEEMVARHQFDRTTLERLFIQVHRVSSVIQSVKPASSEAFKNWKSYRTRFVEPIRIGRGIQFWQNHVKELDRAFAQYGVPPEIIVGILGVETIYGHNTGHFRTLDVLMTLAFEYPDTPNRLARMRYFREEMEQFLLLAREQNLNLLSVQGSYAGAIGWPQFMPSSIRKFAVDFDGDGRVDLHTSVDAIGSVANFLAQHGWQKNAPLAVPVTVRGQAWQSFIGRGLQAQYALEVLQKEGVIPSTLVPEGQLWGLVDLQNGTGETEYWLGAFNFFVVTRYNRSFFYAMSVIELGHQICMDGHFNTC